MKNFILPVLIVIFKTINGQAQENPSKDMIDGAYTALFAEAGTSGDTTDKSIQLVENNGTQMLAVASCEKCFPALYTYNSDLSVKLAKTVFSNTMGLYVIAYQSQGFVIVMPDFTFKENFSFVNFYGKDRREVAKMTKAKINVFALELLDYL